MKLWYIYALGYYSDIKRNAFDSVLIRWMNLEPIIQTEVCQKEKDRYHILMLMRNLERSYTDEPIFRAAVETQR